MIVYHTFGGFLYFFYNIFAKHALFLIFYYTMVYYFVIFFYMTSIDMGWLAGIIDGEAYVGLRPTTPYVIISSTDKAIIDRATECFISLGINRSPFFSVNCWRLVLASKKDIIALLTPIKEHLTGRMADRADIVLKACYLGGKLAGRIARKELVAKYNQKYRKK